MLILIFFFEYNFVNYLFAISVVGFYINLFLGVFPQRLELYIYYFGVKECLLDTISFFLL